jgi:hypothetical protein
MDAQETGGPGQHARTCTHFVCTTTTPCHLTIHDTMSIAMYSAVARLQGGRSRARGHYPIWCGDDLQFQDETAGNTGQYGPTPGTMVFMGAGTVLTLPTCIVPVWNPTAGTPHFNVVLFMSTYRTTHIIVTGLRFSSNHCPI